MANWIDEAACKNVGIETFYADTGDQTTNEMKVIYAKNICRKCPVAAECLMFAISNNEAFGVWGSFAPKERSALIKLFSEQTIDIKLCRTVVNKEIKSIKASILRKEFGVK